MEMEVRINFAFPSASDFGVGALLSSGSRFTPPADRAGSQLHRPSLPRRQRAMSCPLPTLKVCLPPLDVEAMPDKEMLAQQIESGHCNGLEPGAWNTCFSGKDLRLNEPIQLTVWLSDSGLWSALGLCLCRPSSHPTTYVREVASWTGVLTFDI